MPIKYTVTYTLPNTTTDVGIFDTRPKQDQTFSDFLDNLKVTASQKIENDSMIIEMMFPTFTAYRSFIDEKSKFVSDRYNWAESNNIKITLKTEYIE